MQALINLCKDTKGEIRLKLGNSSLEAIDIAHLIKALALATNTILKELSVDLNKLNTETLQALPPLLGAFSHITHLIIMNPSLEKMQDLMTILEQNSSIKSLCIEGSLTSPIIKIIVEFLASKETLRVLTLIKNTLSIPDSETLIHSLTKHPNLKEFVSFENTLSFEAISNLLRNNSSLTKLTLSETRMSKKDFRCLIEGLETNSTLKCLEIGQSIPKKDVDKNIKRLAAYLISNPNLVHLHLNNNKIENKNVAQLVHALEKNCLLTTLDLSNTHPIDKNTANVIDEATLKAVETFVKDRNIFNLKKLQESLSVHLGRDVSSIIMGYFGIRKPPIKKIKNPDPMIPPQPPFIPSKWNKLTHSLNLLHPKKVPSALALENKDDVPPQTVAQNPNPTASNNPGASAMPLPPTPSGLQAPSKTSPRNQN